MTNTIHIFFTALAPGAFATQSPFAYRAPSRPSDCCWAHTRNLAKTLAPVTIPSDALLH
jgi:hypothetical protein